MASPEALQNRAQSLALSLQRRTSCTLREAVRSRAVQISREHLADDFLSRRLSKADYNSLVRLAAEEVLTWPAAIGGPLRQCASGATDELFHQKVVAFLDAKKLLLDLPAADGARAHAPAACQAANNFSPRSHVASLGGQLPHRALRHGRPRLSAPIPPLSHQQ